MELFHKGDGVKQKCSPPDRKRKENETISPGQFLTDTGGLGVGCGFLFFIFWCFLVFLDGFVSSPTLIFFIQGSIPVTRIPFLMGVGC